jgi:hypothetical protein
MIFPISSGQYYLNASPTGELDSTNKHAGRVGGGVWNSGVKRGRERREGEKIWMIARKDLSSRYTHTHARSHKNTRDAFSFRNVNREIGPRGFDREMTALEMVWRLDTFTMMIRTNKVKGQKTEKWKSDGYIVNRGCACSFWFTEVSLFWLLWGNLEGKHSSIQWQIQRIWKSHMWSNTETQKGECSDRPLWFPLWRSSSHWVIETFWPPFFVGLENRP